MVRLGGDLAVRLPRRPEAVALLAHEHRWLRAVAADLPVRVPLVERWFEADAASEVPWAVVRWCPGEALDRLGMRLDTAGARRLAEALGTLASPAPPDAPANPYRGVPLAARDERVRTALATLPDHRAAGLRAQWESALAAPVWAGPAQWIHGDLHPGNLVASGSELTGIIDWGDLTAGDPATDLSVAWTACDPDGRRELRRVLQPAEADWARARGNALAHGLACVANHRADRRVRAIGERTLAEIEHGTH